MILTLIVLLAVVLLAAGFEMLLVLGVPALAYKEAFYGRLPDAAVVQKIASSITLDAALLPRSTPGVFVSVPIGYCRIGWAFNSAT